jgi:hypothetical protein
MKFQVGDVIKCRSEGYGIKRVVKIAEKGELVKGPWYDRDREWKVSKKSYILEDVENNWSMIPFTDEEWINNYELIERPEKTLEEKKVQKAIQRRIEDYLKRAVEAKDPGERNYYSGREDGLQDLYFELFGCYYY